MKRVLKWTLLFGPLLGWLGLVGSCVYMNWEIKRDIHDADGLIWHQGSQPLMVAVEESIQGEVTSYCVRVRQNNRSVFETTMAIDSDMWGGGFVKAVQADTDKDLEIVLWGRREGGWILDHQDGRIVKTPFDRAPIPVRQLTEKWYDNHYFNIIPALVFPFVLIYYLGYGIIRFIVRVRKRKQEKKVPDR